MYNILLTLYMYACWSPWSFLQHVKKKKTIKKALPGKIILKLNTFEFYASRVLRIKYNNNLTTP